jgi:hypothetical protein
MAYVVSIVVAIVTALLGGYAGYRTRWREYLRDQRTRVYAEFVSAFMVMAHVGAGENTLYLSYADALYTQRRDQYDNWIAAWSEAFTALEDATARLRLIASGDVCIASEELEDFLTANVQEMPPLTRETERKNWGEFARRGGRAIEREAARLARVFVDKAAGDVVPPTWLRPSSRR